MHAINGAYVAYPTDYTLDAQGRRVRSFVRASNAATDFVYDAEGHLLGEYSTSGAPIQQFVWLGDTPVAVMGGSAGTGTVDNTSSQVLVTGTWPNTYSSAAQGGNYRSHAAGTGTASFTWKLNPHAADYQLYARWVAGTDRASNATYQVIHAAGVSPVTVDQRVNGSQWVLLGTFRFTFGTGHGVTLTDTADGVVVADAIRILPAGPILSYVYADHLDTPRLLTDDTGRVRWRWLADPFGTVLPENNPEAMGPFTFNLRFPGQRYDAETGLHYNVFRDYDPGTGRYIQSDPLGLEDGVNTFVYVKSRPLMEIDPTGEAAIALPGFGAGASVGGSSGICVPCAAVAGAALGGYAAGTAIYDAYGQSIVDLLILAARGRWICTAKCNHTAIPPNNCCNPPHLTGTGTGHSQEAACRAAKRNATTAASPGCYGRHCRCDSCWKN